MSDLISNVFSLDLWHHNTIIFLTCQVVLYIFLQKFLYFSIFVGQLTENVDFGHSSIILLYKFRYMFI